jgi:NAD(P)-dependent dehydrogenase (short-subunit alcohol dehydrogenase family)
MPTALVTSASRGIGLEFARQYAAAGWTVLAACRDPARAASLRGLPGDIRPVAMDVTDLASVEAAAAGTEPVHLLINSAGIIGRSDDGPGRMDYAEWAKVIDTNTFGPVRVLDAFADRLAAARSALAVTITSGMGSIADVGSGRSLMYRTSKAAVNMAMRARSFDLKPRGITVLVINPGWVRTDMGGASAPLPVADSVAAMGRIFETIGPERTGSFLNYTGVEFPW